MEAGAVTPLLTLKALVNLQEIDARIRELEKDRQQIPTRLKEIEAIREVFGDGDASRCDAREPDEQQRADGDHQR